LKNVEEPIKVYRVGDETSKQVFGLGFTQSNLAQTSTKSKIKILFASIGIILVLALSYFFFKNQKRGEIISGESDKSIAVLPFVNLSDDPDQLYFSDGIMEAILNHLTKIEDLKVISRTSVMQYRDTKQTIPQIARELGVAYILEGGVQRYQDQVRINAQLVEAKTDMYVWSDNYDREFTNIFAIQSEVAQQIANILHATIDPQVMERIESKPTENLEAYNLYLEARFIITNYFKQNEYPKAYEKLEKAIALDPDFALAYTWMANYWLFQAFYTGALKAEKAAKEALPLLEKSLELDDKEFATLSALAAIYGGLWDFKKREIIWNKMREINPSWSPGGWYLLRSGRYQEALAESTEKIRNDANDHWAWMYHGLSLYFNDRHEESLAAIDRVIKQFPNKEVMISEAGRAYVFLKEYDKAIKILEPHVNMLDRRPPRDLGYLALAYYKTDQYSKSNNILEELKKISQESSAGSPAFYISMLHAQMGITDLAFEWLEKAYQEHEGEIIWLKVEPPFEPLYDDPRWQEMLDMVGFPN